MATLRDGLLPVIDGLRNLPNTFGLRRYAVTLRIRTWGGGGIGLPPVTFTDVVLTPPPRVRVISTEEVAASMGSYREGDLRIDKITPQYTTPTAGGYTPAQLNLRPDPALFQDACVLLVGDEGTLEAQVVKFNFDRAFNYSLVARLGRTVR